MSTLPKVCRKGPYAVEVEEGRLYSWCTCGLSAEQPFCDGSHKGTDYRSCKWTAEQSGTIYFCGCKATKNKPLCDGSHSCL